MTTQRSLFDPVLPYGGHAPSAPNAASVAAARAIEVKVGTWQARVLLALLGNPMSDQQLERRLDCVETRTSRPRRRELELAGYVEDSGERIQGAGTTAVTVWRLTDKGVREARRIAGQR